MEIGEAKNEGSVAIIVVRDRRHTSNSKCLPGAEVKERMKAFGSTYIGNSRLPGGFLRRLSTNRAGKEM